MCDASDEEVELYKNVIMRHVRKDGDLKSD